VVIEKVGEGGQAFVRAVEVELFDLTLRHVAGDGVAVGAVEDPDRDGVGASVVQRPREG